jgi:hypothetical protein
MTRPPPRCAIRAKRCPHTERDLPLASAERQRPPAAPKPTTATPLNVDVAACVMRPSGFEPLASSSGDFLSGPTCTDIRATARVFRPRRQAGEPLRRVGVLLSLLLATLLTQPCSLSRRALSGGLKLPLSLSDPALPAPRSPPRPASIRLQEPIALPLQPSRQRSATSDTFAEIVAAAAPTAHLSEGRQKWVLIFYPRTVSPDNEPERH